jgi:hypothetical protein
MDAVSAAVVVLVHADADAMAMNLRRRDSARSIAAVKAFLNSKELVVQSIDEVNNGNDCLYHSISISLGSAQGVLCDRLCQQIDGRQQPLVPFRRMSPQQMRETAAKTIEWLWQTEEQGHGHMKEALQVHMDTEAREHLQRLNRIHEGVSLQTGNGDHKS